MGLGSMRKEKQEFQLGDKVYILDFDNDDNCSLREEVITSVVLESVGFVYEMTNGYEFMNWEILEWVFRTKEEGEMAFEDYVNGNPTAYIYKN